MKKLLIFILLLTSFIAFSQELPERPLNLIVDFAKFRQDAENSYLEFYYSYSPMLLTKIENGKTTEMLIQFMIEDLNTKEIVVNRIWTIKNPVLDSFQVLEQNFMGLTRFSLIYGRYKVLVDAVDLHNKKVRDSVKFEIEVPQTENKEITTSDIEICSSIRQIEKDSSNIFYKNTYEIKPNPSTIFNYNTPMLGYYLECYNLKENRFGSKLYTGYKVLDSYGKEYTSKYSLKDFKKETSVEVGIVNLKDLPGGSFNFVFSILDSTKKTILTQKKRFLFYNPAKKMLIPSTKDLSFNEYSELSEEDLNLLFAQAKYIATKTEIQNFNLLTNAESKKNYLYEFWKNRESDINLNLSKKIYDERVKFANGKYRTKFKEGWATDRGRICLQYGIPAETFIERGKEDEDGRPFEIWTYPTIQNGVLFIFSDESGFNDYRLVHSTHKYEVRDPKWEEYLKNKN